MASRNLAIRTRLNFGIVFRSIQLNLRISPFGRVDFDIYAGFSDHTIGITAPCIAFSRGARILEKHFTLDHTAYGPDHQEAWMLVNLRRSSSFAMLCVRPFLVGYSSLLKSKDIRTGSSRFLKVCLRSSIPYPWKQRTFVRYLR